MQHVHHDLKVYGGIKLFGGTGSPELAQNIADYLGLPLSDREVIEFPNENLFVKLKGSARGQDVYVIQTTSSPVHRNLMELLIMIQTLRLDSAARITAGGRRGPLHDSRPARGTGAGILLHSR